MARGSGVSGGEPGGEAPEGRPETPPAVGSTFFNPLTYLAMQVLVGYKKFLSPLLGSNCRFTPSCSTYAMQALQKYGFVKGAAMSVGRILRCQPMCKGGYDPP